MHSTIEDYELSIDSEEGIFLKKIRTDDNTSFEDIEFYTSNIKSLYSGSFSIDLILKENNIYISTVDEDGERSIKLKYKFPSMEKVHYIYFDKMKSKNLILMNSKKANFVELKYLMDIFLYEIKLRLSPKAKFVETMSNGDYCKNVEKNRKSTVEYVCDASVSDINIEKVSEPAWCEYKYVVKSKNLCNPLFLMHEKIQKSVAETVCYIQNQNFNKNFNEYFEKA